MRAILKGAVLGLLLLGQMAQAGTVLVVGDSISAAFGMDTRQGWVHLLDERMRSERTEVEGLNAAPQGHRRDLPNAGH